MAKLQATEEQKQQMEIVKKTVSYLGMPYMTVAQFEAHFSVKFEDIKKGLFMAPDGKVITSPMFKSIARYLKLIK